MKNAAFRSEGDGFGFGSEEALLRDQARKFLDRHATPQRLRALIGDHQAVYARGALPGYDREAWQHCVELGWTALGVPEACGGLGASTVAVAALVEEVGRHAFPSPLIPTLNASFVLRHAAGARAKEWLERIATGTTMSLAFHGSAGTWELDATEVRAVAKGRTLVLDGSAHFVQDAFKADAFLVAARTSEGLCLAALAKDTPGLTVARDHIFDLTRDQAHLVLSEVVVTEEDIVAPLGQGLAALRGALPSVLTTISADLVGASEWQLQTTVEYAKTRTQFERTLGFFQAVKHPLVDAMMRIDLARSHLYNAARQIDVGADAAEVSARMAKSAASDAAEFMSRYSVQLHGGIGFTWECDVHLFFKRNQHNAALYGDGVHQRKKLAHMLLGPPG